MTIVNVFVAGDRGMMGVDTESSSRDGQRGQVKKADVFCHAQTVLACRGHAAMQYALSNAISSGLVGDSYDAIVDALPDLLGRVYDRFQAQARLGRWTGSPMFRGMTSKEIVSQVVITMGWSERRDRVLAHAWEQTDAGEGFVCSDIEPHYIAPWDASFDAYCQNPLSSAGMHALLRAQARWARREHPEAACGGRGICIALQREGITVLRTPELCGPAAFPPAPLRSQHELVVGSPARGLGTLG